MCIEYYVISWNCRTFIFCSFFSVWMLSMSALLYIEAKCSNQWKWNVCFIFYIIILFAIVTSRYTRFPILVCLSHGLRMIIIHLFWQFNIFGTLAAVLGLWPVLSHFSVFTTCIIQFGCIEMYAMWQERRQSETDCARDNRRPFCYCSVSIYVLFTHLIFIFCFNADCRCAC